MSKQEESYNDFIKKRDQKRRIWSKFLKETNRPEDASIHAKWSEDDSLLKEFKEWKKNNNLN